MNKINELGLITIIFLLNILMLHNAKSSLKNVGFLIDVSLKNLYLKRNIRSAFIGNC